MKQVVYGRILQRSVVKKHLIFLSVVNIGFASCLYLLFVLIYPLPLYCFVFYLCLHYVVVFLYIQYREQKQYIIFDEEGIYVYNYPFLVYWTILRKKEASVLHYMYQDITCSLTYQKALKKNTQRYCLVINIVNKNAKNSIVLQTHALSKHNLDWILLMLSSSAKTFCDRYQLQLCLLYHKDAFDYYIERIKEDHDET